MVDPVQLTIQTFDDTAAQYAEKTDGLLQKELVEKFASRLNPGALILDLGCGPGRDAGSFTKRGFQVIGIDGSVKMIEAAKRRVQAAEFQVMDIRVLNFPDNHFDGVWASASLHFLPKIELPVALKEIYRVLKPDGQVFMSVKLGEGEGLQSDTRYGNRPKYYAYFTQAEFVKYITEAGFREVDSAIDEANIGYSLKGFVNVFCRK